MPTHLDGLIKAARAEVRRFERDPDMRIAASRNIASLLVDMRSMCQLEDGRTDWAGRSSEYRRASREVFSESQLPKEELDRFRTAIRFHISNALHQKAPAEELADLGIQSTAIIDRARSRRLSSNPNSDSPRRQGMTADQVALVYAIEATALKLDATRLRDVDEDTVDQLESSLSRTTKHLRAQLTRIQRMVK